MKQLSKEGTRAELRRIVNKHMKWTVAEETLGHFEEKNRKGAKILKCNTRSQNEG